MLHLRFKTIGIGQEATLGPAKSYRVAGNFIREAKSGEILAKYANHFWYVGEKAFTTYECTQPVLMHFEDFEGGRSEFYGPFDRLEVNDGSLYALNRLQAKFMDTSLLWHDHASDTFWPNLILSSPSS